MSDERTSYVSAKRADINSDELTAISAAFQAKKNQQKNALFVLPESDDSQYIIKIQPNGDKIVLHRESEFAAQLFDQTRESFKSSVSALPTKWYQTIKPKHTGSFFNLLYGLGTVVAGAMATELVIHMAIVGLMNPYLAAVLAAVVAVATIVALVACVGLVAGFIQERFDKVNPVINPIRFAKTQQMWPPAPAKVTEPAALELSTPSAQTEPNL